MNDKLALEREKAQITVDLDNLSYEFRRLAEEANKLGFHIDNEYEVCGDPSLKMAHNSLVENLTKHGQEIKCLTDRLAEINCLIAENE